MEFLRFIFSSFWVWAGLLVLVVAVLNGAAELVKALKPKRSMTAYRIGGRWKIDIDGANIRDAKTIADHIKDESEVSTNE